ncbi:MAG: hypothetical protein ABWJ97_06365 [Thermoproteus sp.]
MSREVRRRVEAVAVREEELVLGDCEVKDFETFSSIIPPTLQSAVLDAIRSGAVPDELKPLMRRLRDAGILICT